MAPAVLLVLSWGASPQEKPDFEVAVAEAVAEVLIPAVEQRIQVEHEAARHDARNLLCERLLAIDPRNKLARKWFKGKRHKELDAERLREFEQELSVAIHPFLDTLAESFTGYEVARHSLRATWALGFALLIHPQDAELRRMLGHRRLGDEWYLAESVQAFERRMRFAVRPASAGLQIQEIAPTEEQEHLLLPWTGSYGFGSLRVLGTGEEAEIRSVAAEARAAARVFSLVFQEAPRDLDINVYLLRESELAEFARYHPKTQRWRESTLGSWGSRGIDGTFDLVVWYPEALYRINAVVRHVLEMYRTRYVGRQPAAWVTEGTGAYLASHVEGAGVFFFSSAGAPALRAELFEADWFQMARELHASGDLPPLRETLARPLCSFTPEDSLSSFLLSAYLVEGTDCIGKAIAQANQPERVFLGELAMHTEDVEQRMFCWLEERFALSAARSSGKAALPGSTSARHP